MMQEGNHPISETYYCMLYFTSITNEIYGVIIDYYSIIKKIRKALHQINPAAQHQSEEEIN